jgi:predicted dehydrogenase
VHLRVLARSDRVALVAVADPSPQARERATRIAHVPVTDDADGLLARGDVDAVVICAPSAEHARLATAALGAGKHVYLEKPLAVDRDAGERVCAAAHGAGVTATIGFNRRFHPVFEQARGVLARGAIGGLRAVRTTFGEPMDAAAMPEWKRSRASGGGALLDLASHHFDLVPWLTGAPVTAVEARISSVDTEGDEAWVRLVLEGGVETDAFFSLRAARSDAIELLGDRGTLRADRYSGRVEVTSPRGTFAVRRRRVRPTRDLAVWRLRRIVRPADEPSYRRALGAWIGALHGESHALPTFDDGLRSLRVVLAAEAAAASGTRVACGS